MARKSKKALSLGEKMMRIRKAGISGSTWLKPTNQNIDPVEPLAERIRAVLEILRQAHQNRTNNMLAFIAYDIESNKIRRLIAKYLLEKGCIRVQKSVYFLEAEPQLYREMTETIRAVQSMYDNEDSLFFLPIALDNINRMEMIGKNLHVEMAIDNPNTLFI